MAFTKTIFAALATVLAFGCGPAEWAEAQEELLESDAELIPSTWTRLAISSVSASANDGNVPGNVLDGSLSTRWSCDGVGCWITADLGSRRTVCGLGLAWYQGATRVSRFAVGASLTNGAFAAATSGQSSGTTTSLETVALPNPASARYVRVTVNGNTVNTWASITELRLYTCATTTAPPSDPTLPTDPITPPGSTFSNRSPVFDGRTGYVEIPDNDDYSMPTRGAITIEAWMRPDSLSMARRESSGYVHWMGKGYSGQHEWVSRMYQEGNSEGRANRISFYSFNLAGGLGTGSYFQDPVQVGGWIHYVGVIDATRTSIYKNGVLRDSDLLSGYDITPRNGSAPVRIGTRDFNSFFQGSVARVAIYGGKLSAERIAAHYQARFSSAYDSAVMSEPSLVGYWKLNETSGVLAADAKKGRSGKYVGGIVLGAGSWR